MTTGRRKHRKCLSNPGNRPELKVRVSNTGVYAQLVSKGHVIASVRKLKSPGSGRLLLSKLVGAQIAEAAIAQGVHQVVYDRGTRPYLGCIAEVAVAARAAGLDF